MIDLLNCNTEALIASAVDGNYTYIRYSNDGDTGTGFSDTYNSSTHNYVGIIISGTEIETPAIANFVGSWVEKQEQYTYFGFATNSSGSGFSSTYTGVQTYYNITNSTTEISSLDTNDFSGNWIPFVASENFISKTFNEYVPNFLDTNQLMHNGYQGMPERTFGPSCYYYAGTYKRFYFIFFEGAQPADADTSDSTVTRRSTGNGYAQAHYNRTWVCYYDLETGAFANPVALTETYSLPGTDGGGDAEEASPHNLPSIIVNDDGNILVFKEDLSAEAGGYYGHNSHIEVWQSDNIEDISAWTKQTEFGNTVEGWSADAKLAYPNVFKLPDGTICVVMRWRPGASEQNKVVIIKSEDGGATWSDMSDAADSMTTVCFLDRSDLTRWRTYIVHASEKSGINIAVHSYDEDDDSAVKDIWFLHSDDGENWENARQFTESSSGFTKNVVTGGYITDTELDDNYLVDNLALGDSLSIMALSAGVDRDNVPYIIAVKTDRSDDSHYNNSDNLYVYYWNTSSHAWTSTDILPNLIISGNSNYDLVSRFRATIIPYESGTYDVFVSSMGRLNEDDFALSYMGDENYQDNNALITDGTLKPGLFYEIVAKSAVTFNNNSDFGVGDIFRENGDTTGNMSLIDNVREIVMRPYRFRTEDYGVSFHPFKLPNGDYKHGGFGHIPYNVNCVIDGKLLLFFPVYETTLSDNNADQVEYANALSWYSDLER